MKITLLISLALSGTIFAQNVTLNDAISIALENNKNLKVSKTSLQIADKLYNQAMSAHYPTLDVSMSAIRLDEAPTFEMRGSTVVNNAKTIGLYQSLSAAAQADNANTPNTLSSTFAGIAAATPATSSLPISMNAKIMGRDTATAKLDMQLPLYTGGKITAITQQAKLGKAIAQEGNLRSRNQVIFDVKKYYYGAVMANKIKKLTSDTLERMGFIRDLTSRMYQGGSMTVKKTDYLRSKMSVNMIAVFYEDIKSKEVMAKAALANAMGYSWEKKIELADKELPIPLMNKEMKTMVKEAYEFNPDYKTLKLAIKVKDAKIDEAQSSYLPQVALFAGVQHMYNDYEYGVINETNKNSWNIGIGVQWSIFNGMRTLNQVEQRRLEKLKVQQQELLLQDGLALQIKQAYLQIQSTYNKHKVLVDAVAVAQENRDLNTRAYQEDMVETKDVIEAQLFEALTEADYYRTQNDHALARAQADLIIGNAIESAMTK